MSEYGDYEPSSYDNSFSFDDARRHYDAHAGRSYDDAKREGKSASSLVPDRIETQSTSPLVILCDVTGSNKDWAVTIFSKLPYLEAGAKEFLGADVEIGFGAIGDANCDTYALQVGEFASGVDNLKARLEGLIIEGGGGGQGRETYELAGLYYAYNVDMPNAVKPILIMIADEMPYNGVSQDQAKSIAKVGLEQAMSAGKIFEELKRKWNVYLVLNPHYGAETRRVWLDIFGEDHVAVLDDPNRIVDVIFGLLAQEVSRVQDFRKEIEGRQTRAQVATVYEALKTIHRLPQDDDGGNALVKAGHSTLRRPSGGKKTQGLV